jgi:hypothetical protein
VLGLEFVCYLPYLKQFNMTKHARELHIFPLKKKKSSKFTAKHTKKNTNEPLKHKRDHH